MIDYSWQSDPRIGRVAETVDPSFDSPKKTLGNLTKEDEVATGLQRRAIRKRVRRQRYLALLLASLGLLLPLLLPGTEVARNLILAACGVLVLASFMDRTPLALRIHRQIPLATSKQVEHRVWGQAGSVLRTTTKKFGSSKVEAGIKGEDLTARALIPLLEIPGVRIFHSMRFPDAKTEDVDHIVVCGNKIAVIDSKFWKTSVVTWNPDGSVTRQFPDGGSDTLSMSIHNAVRGYAEELQRDWWQNYPGRPDPEMRGVVVTHCATPSGDISVPVPVHNGIMLTSAQEAVENIGRWFLEGRVGRVDRRILLWLIERRKDDRRPRGPKK